MREDDLIDFVESYIDGDYFYIDRKNNLSKLRRLTNNFDLILSGIKSLKQDLKGMNHSLSDEITDACQVVNNIYHQIIAPIKNWEDLPDSKDEINDVLDDIDESLTKFDETLSTDIKSIQSEIRNSSIENAHEKSECLMIFVHRMVDIESELNSVINRIQRIEEINERNNWS